MNGKQIVLGMLVAALVANCAWAVDSTGWCGTVTGTPVLMCDDFDDYCGDPPCDDEIGDDTPDQAAFLTVWPRSDCNCLDYLGNEVNATVVNTNTCNNDCLWPHRPCDGTEFCGDSGPFSLHQREAIPETIEDYPDLKATKYIFYGTSHRHDLVPRIQELNSEKGSIDGTDDEPLVLQFVIDAWGLAGSSRRYGAAQINRYIELTDGSDRAPAEVKTTLCDCCGNEGKLRPQVDRENGKNHSAIAIGIFAVIDEQVCGEDNEAARPLTYRLALYDGDKWIELKEGVLGTENPSGLKGALVAGHLNYITMAIKSSTIEIELQCSHEYGDPYISTATAPRMYTGGFSAMHVGNGACLPSADDDYVDNVALAGGVLADPIATGACCMEGGSCIEDTTTAGCENRLGGQYSHDGYDCATANCPQPPGACCVDDPTGEGDFCTDTDQDICENTLGGTFNGDWTTCDDPDILCCPDPFADADADGDVDQVDFGLWQVCFSGDGNNHPDTRECKCFDRVDTTGAQGGDGDIDRTDFEWFWDCLSGPTVLADTECDN